MGGDPTLVGTTLAGRYSLLRLLGDGGMGAVYQASDQVLQRFVAIKLLHRHLASDPLLVERFQREARSAAAIGHPNIIDIIDFGEADGAAFMVMEYLRGRSLARLLEIEGPLAISRACSIAAHTLAGLSAAHDRGIIHRDLKPANLMLVSRLGDHDFVKVCDFGFAAFIVPRSRADRDITPERTLVGTPSYVAPEKWQGDERRDPRVDLYAVGVILFETLTGGKPFEASTVSELARSILKDRPRSVRSLRPDVPEELALVIERALAKRPDDRWQSAAAFAEALVPFGGRIIAVETEDEELEQNALEPHLRKIRAREERLLHGRSFGSIELSLAELVPIEEELAESAIRLRTEASTATIEPPKQLQAPVSDRAFEASVVLAILRFLGEHFGERTLRDFLEGLPENLRSIFGAPVRPGVWIPYDAVRGLMEHIDRRLGSDDLRFIVECGRAIAQGVFELKRNLEPVVNSPQAQLAELPSIGRTLVRGVAYSVQRVGSGHGRIEVTEATDRPSITGCVATIGFIERSLSRAGANDIEVHLLSCRALGDERCLFDVTWLT